jgi:hypothetical protein
MGIRNLWILAPFLLSLGCAGPGDRGADPVHISIVGAKPDGSPAGWIYSRSAEIDPALCVYVWPDRRWEVAAETSPGYYGDVLASGEIAADGTAVGLRPELGESIGRMLADESTYCAGSVAVSVGGRELGKIR